MNTEDFKKEEAHKSETDSLITNQEIDEIREDVFKSGIAMKVDETPTEYTNRVNTLWKNEQKRNAQETVPEKPTTGEISDEVKIWLGHPLTESYAQRYLAGEEIDGILQGQKNIEEKRNAITLLASYLSQPEVSQVEGGDAPPDTSQEKLTTENATQNKNEHDIESTSSDDLNFLKAYDRAKQYVEKLQNKSTHPERFEQYLKDWKDQSNVGAMNDFLMNARYKEYREVDYPIEPNYESVFNFATTDESVPHTHQNGWIYRGTLPTHETPTKTRGSLNIHVTQECIQELDALITSGVFVGNYKFGEPNTPAEASERHDSITLYFLEEPTDETQTALATIAQKYHRGESLLGKEVTPGFSMSEITSINENQIEEILSMLATKAPEIVPSVENYVTRAQKDGEPKRLAMSEAQYYAIKDTLALYGINLSIDANGSVAVETSPNGTVQKSQ